MRKAGLAAASRLLQELPELECVAELWVRAALPMVRPMSQTGRGSITAPLPMDCAGSREFVSAPPLQAANLPHCCQISCITSRLCMAWALLCVLAS